MKRARFPQLALCKRLRPPPNGQLAGVKLTLPDKGRISAAAKGFGRRPIATVGQAPGPSSESAQGRNPRGVEVGKTPRAMAI